MPKILTETANIPNLWNVIMDYLRSGYQHLTGSINYGLYLIQIYAWHIILGGVVVYYIFIKFLRPALEWLLQKYERYRKLKEEQEYDAKYHKDPDFFSATLSAQQAAAQKLQDKYNQQAKEYQAKLREKENQKRRDLDNAAENRTVTSLRPEYNPLMSSGHSSNYRPTRRSKCGGGGCGK